jgi:hypothetical protein
VSGERQEPGWYTFPVGGVCREQDSRWYAYPADWRLPRLGAYRTLRQAQQALEREVVRGG